MSWLWGCWASAAISFLAEHRLLVATSMTDATNCILNRRQL